MAVGDGPLTVDYDEGRKASYVFVLMTLLAAVVCAWMALESRHEEPGAAFTLSAVCSMWLSVAGLLWLSTTDPARLVTGRFDNETRRFVLTAADGVVCALPYHELESFAIRRKVSTGKHKRVTYVVYAQKKDGGFWDLRTFGDDDGLANEMLRELRGSVKLAGDDADEPDRAQPLPATISREDVDGVTRFAWRNQERFADVFCGALCGASLIALPFGIAGVMTGAHTFFHLLAALAVIWIARRNYKSSGRTFQLEISDRFLTYSTRGRGNAEFQVSRVLTVVEVTRLQSIYELARSQQERAHQLTFVGEPDASRLQARRLADRNTESLGDAVALDRAIIELDLPGIRTAEVLQLEQHLQRELGRRGQNVA